MIISHSDSLGHRESIGTAGHDRVPLDDRAERALARIVEAAEVEMRAALLVQGRGAAAVGRRGMFVSSLMVGR